MRHTLVVFLISLAGAQVPPFGTVVGRWSLPMSGPYCGAGITWRRDSATLVLVDQGAGRLWQLDPADPAGTIRPVPWHMVDLGVSGPDLPWGIVWDEDSGCFWMSQIDGFMCDGCRLVRYVWNDTDWVWGGTPRDSWLVGNAGNTGALQCLWMAGMARNAAGPVFYGTPVATSPTPLNHVVRFDPYTKTDLGRLPEGDSLSERGCTLIPWDSGYVLTCGPPTDRFVKRDSTGHALATANAPSWPADWAVPVPDSPAPDDTVWAFCIQCSIGNYLYRVSTGLCWGQLNSGVFEPGAGQARTQPVKRTICPSAGIGALLQACTIIDASGRQVKAISSGPGHIRALPAGIYFIRDADSGKTLKLSITR